ncbi:hypothetical protein RND71_015435 [Anisodus tanguticus]|uniref:Uncharacterized protein n=1 Tax=Anisodus tanguticus TaxID=243964 RepID=A0AAE1S6H5_9SOLA|nr:hypothetical protein RND71_015435 [Anisodus tanguticus]
MMNRQKSRGKPCKELAKEDETITHEPLGFSFTSVPRKSRTKTIVKRIVKKDQKFNSPASWIDYKRESRKEDSRGIDQTCNIYYSKPLSEYEIPGPVPDDLDALLWDKKITNLNFWDGIPDLEIHDV